MQKPPSFKKKRRHSVSTTHAPLLSCVHQSQTLPGHQMDKPGTCLGLHEGRATLQRSSEMAKAGVIFSEKWQYANFAFEII